MITRTCMRLHSSYHFRLSNKLNVTALDIVWRSAHLSFHTFGQFFGSLSEL